MGQEKTDVSGELMEALEEFAAHARGEGGAELVKHTVMVPDIDVQAIRKGLGLKRPEFCRRFGFELRTLQDWEQGRRRPDKAARTLLLVIARAPEVVAAAVQDAA